MSSLDLHDFFSHEELIREKLSLKPDLVAYLVKYYRLLHQTGCCNCEVLGECSEHSNHKEQRLEQARRKKAHWTTQKRLREEEEQEANKRQRLHKEPDNTEDYPTSSTTNSQSTPPNPDDEDTRSSVSLAKDNSQ